jgi:hypothetical protein
MVVNIWFAFDGFWRLLCSLAVLLLARRKKLVPSSGRSSILSPENEPSLKNSLSIAIKICTARFRETFEE